MYGFQAAGYGGMLPSLDWLGSILSFAGRRLEHAVELSSDVADGTGDRCRRRLRPRLARPVFSRMASRCRMAARAAVDVTAATCGRVAAAPTSLPRLDPGRASPYLLDAPPAPSWTRRPPPSSMRRPLPAGGDSLEIRARRALPARILGCPCYYDAAPMPVGSGGADALPRANPVFPGPDPARTPVDPPRQAAIRR